MRLSHRMLAIAVLLTGGLMVLSQTSEILSLSDNVSNDCEATQIVRRSQQQCVVEDSSAQTTAGGTIFSASSRDRGEIRSFLSSSFPHSSSSLLLLLVTQRK
jgi:hypothetical protein